MMCTNLLAAMLLVALRATVISCGSEASQTAEFRSGQAADLKVIRTLLHDAIVSGAERVVIPPGTYRGTPEGGGNTHVVIRNVRNLTVVADGVTIICEQLTRALEITQCENVTISGLSVDYDPLPFTQGVITAVASDKSWIDVSIHSGYPRLPYDRVDIIDPKTRTRKRGMPFLWGTTAQMVEADAVRVSLPAIGDFAEIGDLVSLSTGAGPGGIPHAVVIADSSGITFQSVTVYAAPGFGILDSGGEGGTHLTGCRIVPGPKPQGAEQQRLLSTSWDAIQHKISRRGPRVENCEIRDAGDDSWSVQASDYVVLKKTGNRVVVAPRDAYSNNLQVGDRLLEVNGSKSAVIQSRMELPLAEADLAPEVLTQLEQAEPWTFWKLGTRCIVLTLDDASPFTAGTSVFSPDRQCNGFIFRNNRVHSPGRILIKSSDGVIEDNVLTDGHGIVVCPEVPGMAAAEIRNVIIRGNTLSGHRYFCPAPWGPQAGAISVVAEMSGTGLRPPGVFRNIIIQNNRLSDINGLSIAVSSAHNVVIAGNRIAETHLGEPDITGAQYGIDQTAAIWIANCDDVTLTDNSVEKAGPFLKQLLVLAGGTTRIVGADSGVRSQSANTE
ncbi:MAG TPA: hypothetical protein PK098_01315 [Phycisphaerales bacterium]|nr:hypothetical protein [Phycisphaerales bacterium]